MNALKRFFGEFLDRHQDKLWWFHSSYSLLLGIGVMWLGAKHFAYLRLAVFHIAFIWAQQPVPAPAGQDPAPA